MRLQELMEAMRGEVGVVQEADLGMKGTFAAYLSQAEKAFLEAAAEQIKKIAGGHAEKVSVVQDGPTTLAFLYYKGQDRSDEDMDFSATVTTLKYPNAIISMEWMTVRDGRGKRDANGPAGTLRPEVIVDQFKGIFGAR